MVPLYGLLEALKVLFIVCPNGLKNFEEGHKLFLELPNVEEHNIQLLYMWWSALGFLSSYEAFMNAS